MFNHAPVFPTSTKNHKTALLRKATEGRRSVFCTADLGSPRDHLASFSTAASEILGREGLEGAVFQSWEQAQSALARALRFVRELHGAKGTRRKEPSLRSADGSVAAGAAAFP